MATPDPARRRTMHSWRTGPEAWTLQRDGPTPGAPLIDLASNDYLGLSRHSNLIEAATKAVRDDGSGAGGSRLVTGSRPRHRRLERELGEWLGRDSVLLFPSGFQANIAAVCLLADRHSTVLADRLIHHSLLVGVQASGARLQRFRHNDLIDLERRLSKLDSDQGSVLVISESLFSMEGTSPDIDGLVNLCHRFGVQLLLDEAHALGVLGPEGRGLGFGRGGIDLISGTFGKAFGSGGAFLACDAALGDKLLQSSGAFRYTTALAPALVGAAQAALDLIRLNHGWGEQLIQRSGQWREAFMAAGWRRPDGYGQVLPVVIGADSAALEAQAEMEQAGLLAVAIRPPTVPEGTARLRLVLRRDLPEETLDRLLQMLPSR
ncbi:MAG: aminotransferase class I/II-fold pyridoxal phosphate-dependent enzyme [Synechococcus sp.]